jgi:hypothetical protein
LAIGIPRFLGFQVVNFRPPKKKTLNSTKFVTIFGNFCQNFVITKCKKKHLQLNCKREYKKVWCLTKQGVCQSHCCLAIYIEKDLKAKEELWKLKYFTMPKYSLQNNPLKETQILQDVI